VRDFNIDVFRHVLPSVVQDNTIYINHPDFAKIVYKHYRDLGLSYETKGQPA